jgi:hypothetical protein
MADGEQSDPLNNVRTTDSNISGSSLICSSEYYFVDGVPLDGTITWSTSSSNIFLSSDDNDNPAIFSYYSNGNGTITAEINSSCINYVLHKNVHTGPFSSSDYEISGPDEVYCESYAYFSIPILEGATDINWDWPEGWTYISGQGTEYIELLTGDYSSSGIVSVGVDNNCGPSGSYDTQYVNVFGYCGYSLSLSPNPAFNEVTVTINEPERELNEVSNAPINLDILTSNIIITDRVGIVYGTFQKKSRTFTVSVENLKNGNYILTVVIGNFRISAPFIVSH